MYTAIRIVSALSVLLIASAEDIKYKKIHVLLPLTVCFLCILLLVVFDNYSLVNLLMDMSLGVGLMIYSFMSRGKIGQGDGIIMCMVGIASGISTAVIVMCFASIFSFVYMVIHKLTKKTDTWEDVKDIEVPFLPFAAFSYIIINAAIICG